MTEPQYREFHGIRALSAVDALSIAASNSKLKEMQLLLDDGVDINAIASYSKRTALSAAASQGALKSVELLLKNGADANALNADWPAPHFVIQPSRSAVRTGGGVVSCSDAERSSLPSTWGDLFLHPED